MKSLVNYAIQYAKKGFSVIPTIGKKPLVKFADREPLTSAEIEKFWTSHPYANIALKTDQFFVVDVTHCANGRRMMVTNFSSLNLRRELVRILASYLVSILRPIQTTM